ncbi:MAG: DUF5618 family protein [Candidatus Brocadiales bacterium]|nr:DUF5618 family protein [Candidatus Brocadiales bacterium]
MKYLNNVKEILISVPVEDNVYTNIKPVREAFGTAYLAVLEAINEFLIIKKGSQRKNFRNR